MRLYKEAGISLRMGQDETTREIQEMIGEDVVVRGEGTMATTRRSTRHRRREDDEYAGDDDE